MRPCACPRVSLASIGLIGSSAKWARFQTNLAEHGHTAERIATITCPIGLPDHRRQGAGRDRRLGRRRPDAVAAGPG